MCKKYITLSTVDTDIPDSYIDSYIKGVIDLPLPEEELALPVAE